MSKSAVAGASAGVLGTGGVATLGAHYMGAFGGGSDASYLAKTVDEFQKSNGGLCLRETFPEIPSAQTISSKQSNAADVAKGDTKLGKDKNKDSTGCLVVNWDKSPDLKKSNFRLLWTLYRDNAGFAVYMTGDLDSSSTTPKMTWDGIAYTFAKKGGNWETKKLKMKNKTASGVDIKTYFPSKKTSGFPKNISGDVNAYWNFLDGNGNKVEEVKNGKYQGRYFLWWDKQYSDDSIVPNGVQWSPYLSTWWNYFFGTAAWDMSTVTNDAGGWWRDEKPEPFPA